MKKKLVYTILSVAVVATLLIVGFTYSKKHIEQETQYISASWVYNYADINEIAQDSDIIALIRVSNANKSYMRSGVPFTNFDVEVITPIYGTELGEALSIVMTGGINGEGIMVEVSDDPLLRQDEEFLIFAKRNENGTVTIISGPQGRLVHTNGKLNSLTTTNSAARTENQYSSIQVVNADFDEVTSEIRNAISCTQASSTSQTEENDLRCARFVK